MRDPHVAKLIYRLVPEPGLVFRNAPPLHREIAGLVLHLESDILIIDLLEHYATPEAAKAAIDPLLDAWIVDAELRTGGRLQFEYERSEIVDRTPSDGAEDKPSVVHSAVRFRTSADGTIERHEYPEPPTDFAAPLLVTMMWDMWSRSRRRQPRLTDMGNFCLTAITAAAGGKKEARDRYGIGRKVLEELGRLSGDTIGDRTTVRKVTARTAFRPHSSKELAWIDAVVKKIIRRVGEREANPRRNFPLITLEDPDLPRLT